MELRFGENIRRLRVERGLTQEKLAEFLGVSFQAVSKWERGETVPDLYMLPTLASFFAVTTDELLGMDEAAAEREIEASIARYYELWQAGDYEGVLAAMKAAVKAYPGEYRLLVRYLNVLVWFGRGMPERVSRGEIEAVYTRIREYCTTDSIRVWARKLMCQYYAHFAAQEGSGVTQADVDAELAELPLMQNCRDFLAGQLTVDGAEKAKTCRKTVDELAWLLARTVREWVSACSETEKTALLERVANALSALYPDGDFGKCAAEMARLAK